MIATNEQLAYAAGLFDGEGCCGVYADGAKHCAIRVQLVMCAPYGPSLFAELFGGHVKLSSYRRPKATGGEYQPVYIWSVTAERAAASLRALLPWLHDKKTQAELVIEARQIQNDRRRHREREYHPAALHRIGEIRDKVKALKRATP